MTQRSAIADTICRTIELGVTITDAAIDGEDRTHLFCQLLDPKNTCPTCGQAGRLRDHVDREVADLPIVGHPTRLHLSVPRYVCATTDCTTSVFRADISAIVAPRAQVTRRTTTWIMRAMISDKMSVKAVAAAVGLSWNTVNTLALAAVKKLAAAPARLAGVRVLGVDEHKWKHVRGKGDPNFVTVLVDLTPIVDGTGPARLLDMVAGRSKAALKDWLGARDQGFRDRIRVVTMDGFTGYRTATAEALDKARVVMDPFHVVHLAAEKLTLCRQRVQQDTCGHRGRSGDPLYGIRRTLLTRIGLLTDKQKTRLRGGLDAREEHVAVAVTYAIYQELIDAYEQPTKRDSKIAMYKLLKKIKTGVPAGLSELAQLGRSLWSRRAEILAYFDTGASNGPVEAINGRLEHLRGIALGFRNLTHYILRSLIHSGQLAESLRAL
ncbi:ISL3 family transposase [Gordonia sp. NB41Y]|nr:ISL3 family transposase [Gordonia sp. NB41Y]WLP88433.1 ISL3 family transposase [Gordonia sp. NB41Y]WLP89123.1 ISL3 family transposase [Gordonia sp. NB41Y]WLP89141.1 ISL3 family transposase [Gordonia sp. NB41Y]WLP89516.1 ISL3 family transposase [Gordonia sp. NB41Y]WLP89727.1 ISL3 family transposase [Gordonia sp. NB41Y]